MHRELSPEQQYPKTCPISRGMQPGAAACVVRRFFCNIWSPWLVNQRRRQAGCPAGPAGVPW